MIRFSHDGSGKNRKRSRPWHGPYSFCDCPTPDVVASKVYFPEEESIGVTPLNLPIGFYWYGHNQASLQTYMHPRRVEELNPLSPGDISDELHTTRRYK